jgi:hypothetical protein
MVRLRRRRVSVIAFAIGLVVTGGVGVAHTTSQKDRGALPYTVTSFDFRDAQRAFGREGIRLALRSRGPEVVTLGNRGDLVEVDAFGDAKKLARDGFEDGLDAKPFPRQCGADAIDAEGWRGNVRVIVNCRLAGSASEAWFRRVDRALALL